MSDLFKSKQFIHVIGEVVVVAGVSIFLWSRIKAANLRIQELQEKVEQLETVLKQQGEAIQQIAAAFRAGQMSVVNQAPTMAPSRRRQRPQKPPVVINPPTPPTPPPPQPMPTHDFEIASDNDSDLDDEIRTELGELLENEIV